MLIFQETFTGFTAAGFNPTPGAGQLDSDIWLITGMSDSPNPAFGFVGAAGTDFGRGTVSTGNPTTGGVYATTATTSVGQALIVQATGTDAEPGSVTARIENTTGGALTDLAVSFDWIYRNNDTRVSALTFAYSTDGATFTSVPGAAFSTSAAGTDTAFSSVAEHSLSLGGVTLAAGQSLYLRWGIASTGSGGRDEVGLDNVTVEANAGPTQSVSIAAASADKAEGDAGTTDYTFTVTRSTGTGAASVDWSATGLGGSGQASAGDFQAVSGTVSFADGETAKTLTVNVLGDTTVETDETFSVALSNPSSGLALGTASAAAVIRNDDTAPPPAIQPWINEFHYDNTSGDTGEFIEVAGLAGTSLSGYSLVLYNGNGGGAYNTLALGGVIPDQSGGFGVVAFTYPVNGLQNGTSATDPNADGIALVGPGGVVVEFISYEGVLTATAGPANGQTSTDVGVFEPGTANGTSIARTGPAGVSGPDFTWVVAGDDTPGAVNGGQTFGTPAPHVRVADVSIGEGDGGTKTLTFIVSRSGTGEAFSVDYATADGTAMAGSDYVATAGTLNFATGQATQTVSVTINGDVVTEANETLFLNLTNATGPAVITDAQGQGTLLNDDLAILRIYEIQGAAQTSPYVGQHVKTEGVVTAVDVTGARGFWIQDASGDHNDATSDAVFVFTNAVPTVTVGQLVQVEGNVSEFAGSDANNLTTTEITSPIISVVGTGSVAATLVGAGGRLPPTQVIDDDHNTSYDPATDGLDFYESLEGMLVTIPNAQVVDASDGNSTWVVGDLGAHATGMNSRGGITISADDFNPERIQLFFDAGVSSTTGSFVAGDHLGDVTGVVSYFGGDFEVIPTSVGSTATGGPLARETTLLRGDADEITIGAYNVENLDPTDPQAKFDLLGRDIAQNLGSPDIVGLEEIQDADGAGSGTNFSGAVTAQKLIDAIVAAGGPHYVYIEVAPTANNVNGGEPNGNIRQGFLYNPDRVQYVDGSIRQLSDTDPTNGDAYNNSRHPLVADFVFHGETITAIDVHNFSRGGSDEQFGQHQPPEIAGEQRRFDQTTPVKQYVEGLFAAHADVQVIVMGDFNGFQFEAAQTQLESGGALTNLTRLLPDEEQFSYGFAGDMQQIDHIFASPGLVGSGAEFDIVHLNSGQLVRPTDHDAVVSRFLVNTAPVATADGYAASEDVSLVVGTLGGVLANDTDVNLDTLTAVLQAGPAHGALTLNADGSFSYLAAANYNGADSFTYLARDPTGAVSDIRTVTLNVAAVNDAPVAGADAGAVNEDQSVTIDVLANDNDVDVGDSKSLVSVSASGSGATVAIVGGKVVYTADADAFDLLTPGQTATDSFTYVMRDAAGETSSATVAVTIAGVADGPTITGGSGADSLTGTAADERIEGGNGSDRLLGLDGADSLNGGNGDDQLLGGAGIDSLTGGSGTDTLEGGAGDDWLSGGKDGDRFVFNGLFGDDTVADFGNGDRLVLDHTQFADYGAVMSRAAQVGSDVVITLDGADSITLLGLQLSSIKPNDFLFV